MKAFKLRQRMTRTRVRSASCRNSGGYSAPSGSGESWFELRRGNAHRDNGGLFLWGPSGSPRLQLRHPDVAFLRSDGAVERSTVGAEPVEGMLAGGVVESRQQAGGATRHRYRPDRRPEWTVGYIVDGLPVWRPRREEGLLARRGVGHQEARRSGGWHYPQAVG